jgi:hypothetical protein
MAIFYGQRPEAQFTRVPNQWARDPKLSLKAKGLLAYVLSHQDGYRLTIEQAVAESVGGKTAVYSAIRELVDHGYLRRDQRRGPSGKVGEVDYYVSDAPDVTASGFSASGKPESGRDQQERNVSAGGTASRFSASGETACGKSATKKTMSKKTKIQKEEKTTSPLPPVEPAGPFAAGARAEEEGEDFSDQTHNPHRIEAARLAGPYTGRIRNGQHAQLRSLLADALHRGWQPADLERELASPHDGLKDVGAGLIGRVKSLEQPPAPPLPTPPPAPEEQCPHPEHNDVADNCGICWADVRARCDPFEDFEDLRPEGWHKIYNLRRAPHSLSADAAAQIARIAAGN